MIIKYGGTLLFCFSLLSYVRAQEQALFAKLNQLDWKVVLADSNQFSWNRHWTLDGERAVLKNTKRGRLFCAGPVPNDNGSHAVLWTKDTFCGPIKIEFEYTRMDAISRFVTIIYIQATGTGLPPYTTDISQWDSLRTIPTMSTYFRHMNTYHISFAVFGTENEDPTNDYVRARRYPVAPGGDFVNDTALSPDYQRTGLFKPGVTYTVTVVKKDEHLVMQVKNETIERVFSWNTNTFPPIREGRVGFRHMYTRCARYSNIVISNVE